MNESFGKKAVVISNRYNFACETMVSKPIVVELEQGGPLGSEPSYPAKKRPDLFTTAKASFARLP